MTKKVVLYAQLAIFVIMLGIGLFTGFIILLTSIGIGHEVSLKNKDYDSSTYGVITTIKGKEALVSYEVDSKEYNGVLPYYSSNMRIGQKVKVLYDSKNPQKFFSDPFKNLFEFKASFLSVIIPSVLFIAFCIFMILKITVFKTNKGKSRKILMKKGIKVQGIVQDITFVSSNNLSKKLGRIIICSYNTMDGKSVIANSEPTVKKIEKFYNKGEYKVIDVYINPENNWDYYVDINSINSIKR